MGCFPSAPHPQSEKPFSMRNTSGWKDCLHTVRQESAVLLPSDTHSGNRKKHGISI